MCRLIAYILVGFVLIQAVQVSLAAIENVSRGKRTVQSSTYGGTSDKAVDGNYDNTDLNECATLLHQNATRSSPGSVIWEVDLGALYAIVSVTIYNTAVIPEGTFTQYLRVCARHRNGTSNSTRCVSIWSYNSNAAYRLQPGGNVTVHFNQLIVADVITIIRYGFLTLCEVDVLGAQVVLATDENASLRRSARQSATVPGRSADLAVDGNAVTNDVTKCASAYYMYLGEYSRIAAWWQVNLGDFYLVRAITVYFPTASPDDVYTDIFNTFISFNDSLPPYSRYSGPGTCYRPINNVPLSGISSLNCTWRYYTGLLLTVGRYVTIMPYHPSHIHASVLTICEVTVIGVRQNIAADDPALDVFRPAENRSNNSQPDGNDKDKDVSETVKASAVFAMSVAAVVVAGVCVILIIIVVVVVVIVKLRGHNASVYQQNVFKQPQQMRMQEGIESIYVDTVDEDAMPYEYVPPPAETQFGRRGLPSLPTNQR